MSAQELSAAEIQRCIRYLEEEVERLNSEIREIKDNMRQFKE